MRRTLADAVLEAAEQHKPKKPTLRRFTWCRIHHELLRKPLWRLIARLSGAPLPHVKLMVIELEIYASENTPRGSVEGFDIAALAADWGFAADDTLARIYASLEDRGWIDQDFIVTFWDRNPDVEDPTAAERQRRAYAKKKAAKAAGKMGYPHSRVSNRETVSITTRSDQIIQKEGGLSVEERSETPDVTDQELWLAGEGVTIVVRRCAVTPERATTMIRDWRKKLDGNLAALAQILAATDLLGVSGGQFADCVRQETSRQRAAHRTLPLPFPPHAIPVK